jgi:hypothetical protein
MAHFARIKDGFVDFVVVGRNEDENNEEQLAHDGWIYKRTSYNTRGGIHYQADNNTPSQDQSKAFRKNYAGIGYYYDSIRDAFIPPKPFPSWTLNEQSCLWQSPIPYPNDGKMYTWNEELGNWEEINLTR